MSIFYNEVCLFLNQGDTDEMAAGCSSKPHSAMAPVRDVTGATYVTGAYGR